jgi:cytoskeleton protein RodZ
VSIGQTLAEARRAAGLSIDELSDRTRLRATIIRAIENDDFSLCGGDFYARAHVRMLASMVGADADALAAEFDTHVADLDEPPMAAQIRESEAATREITKTATRRAPNWGAAVVGAALVVVIVVVGAQLLNRPGKHSPTTGAVGSVPATASPSPTPSGSTSPSPSSSPTPTQSPSRSAPSSAVAQVGVHIVLRVTTAKCWVLATASDGGVIYQGVMNPGDVQTFSDPRQIALKLGNAPATDLVVNGVDLHAPPSKNDVASFTFGPGDPTQALG